MTNLTSVLAPQKILAQKGFYISATKKSSGKTVVSLGIGAALSQSGLRVQAYKKGPDYIDPMWHKAATGRDCFNLDFFTQSANEIQHAFDQHRQNADVVYIEGNKGLFDGMDTHGADCNAALANQLNLPVVLIVNAQGITRGIAPLLKGYEAFAQDKAQPISYAGIILNEVAGPRHEAKLIAAIKAYTDLTILGVVPKSAKLILEERHLGLIPHNEASSASAYIKQAAGLVKDNVDLQKLIQCAANLGTPKTGVKNPSLPLEINSQQFDIKIGIARDAAFGFYYPDDLLAMESMGAKLCYFDAIKDKQLPEVDGLFIGGGFPETNLTALCANESMRGQIQNFISAGKPVYAECGGLMYLCKKIIYQHESAEMVGVIDADIQMSKRPIGRGYAKIQADKTHPWGKQMASMGALNCHEFHYSSLQSSKKASTCLSMAYDVHRGHGVDGERDGIVVNNCLANYSHQRHTKNNPWVLHFLNFVQALRQASNPAPNI